MMSVFVGSSAGRLVQSVWPFHSFYSFGGGTFHIFELLAFSSVEG